MDMVDFYEKWLKFWDEEEEQRTKARKVIHSSELEWLSTKQDKRVALLAAPENGFCTMGGVSMLVEIPVGWRTGKCSGGEVAIYILEGKGCSVIDGLRYEWEKGAAIAIPFGSVYQHYNTGDVTVRFIAANAIHLERFVGLAKLVQFEECSEIPEGEPREPTATSDILFRFGRIVLHADDAPRMIVPPRGDKGGHYHSQVTDLMGRPETGFNIKEAVMNIIMCDDPIKVSGRHPEKHAHMEAHVYILQGEGYSIVDGEKIPWEKGALLHVQGPQTMHEHFNTGPIEAQMLRIHFGIRENFYDDIAKRTFPYIGSKGNP